MTDCIECQLVGKTCDACALERERAVEWRENPKNRRALLKQDARDWVTDDDEE